MSYRSLAALVLLVVLARTHVTIWPGWAVGVIPLILVSAAIAMTAVLWAVLRPGQRPAGRRYRPALAGG
jgi:hypothetical protein